MKSLATLAIAMTAASALQLCVPGTAESRDELRGGLSVGQIFTSNVFGAESAPADEITDARGWVDWSRGSHLRFETGGRLVRFLENPALNHGYVHGRIDGQWAASEARQRYAVAITGTWRLNGILYAPYDYREAACQLRAKRYLSPSFTAQLGADLVTRSYPGAPQESAREAWLSSRLSRSLPTRTSLGATARIGGKGYLESLPNDTEDVGGERRNAALWEVGVQGAQLLTERFAARAWWDHSRLFRSTDLAQQLAGYENPLVDEFAVAGDQFGAALKAILPCNCTADLSCERMRLDYPGRPPLVYDPVNDVFLVDAADQLLLGVGERRDEVWRVRLDIDLRIASSGNNPKLSLRGGVQWTEQDSNDLYWVWRGWSVDAGAALDF